MKRIFTSLIALVLAIAATAQDIIVTMTPTQQILPPQALLYMSQPNSFFNVSLMNTTSEVKQVYLGMSLNQVAPSTSVSINVSARRQPDKPFVIPAHGTYQLTLVDMKKLFDHVPSSEVQMTPNLFQDFNNGSLGLLPEGDYEAQMVAYQWNPSLKNPLAVSSLIGGKCSFSICYKAQAPQFLTPMVTNAFDLNSVAELDPALAQFTWTAPVVACNPAATNFQYKIKIVELLKNQSPNDAMDKNPVVYQSPSALVSPLCILPKTVTDKLDAKVTYVAQVTASVANLNTNYLNYALLENDGKSTLRLFKLKATEKNDKATETKDDKKEDKKDDKKDEKKDEKEDDEEDSDDIWVKITSKGGFKPDSTKLYTFRNPEIINPSWNTNEKTKKYIGENLRLSWHKAWFVGGEGERPDTLNMQYDVKLYVADELTDDYDAVLKDKEPIYKRSTKELADTIAYETFEDKVKAGQYMYLHIEAECLNEESVAWVDSLCNKKSWALVGMPTKQYFQCSNNVEIEDYKPTNKKASELKGTTVTIGEYRLTLDEIEASKDKKDRFSGKGHIEWRPLGVKVMVAVQFDTLGINNDGVVYGGLARTYPRPEISNTDAVREIFTDLGINDWASDLGLPYGSTIDKYTKEAANKVANKVDISQYYKQVKTAKGIWDDLTSGEIKDLYFPVQLPKSINKSPVDIQLFSATFAPQWAKMNVIGEFTLPESKYVKDNILILAAPRLCISPERLLPESGTLALMKDFTIVDPKSQFEFTFNAPDDLEAPTKGCFVSWHADELELFDIDVSMLIPNIKKVDEKGNKTENMPSLNLHASIGSWDDWYAEGSMDSFMSEDLDGWIFQPGKIAYDHSIYRSATSFSGLPKDYDRVKAGMVSAMSDDKEWQGLFIEDMGVVFPKMLKVSDKDKNWEGHLKLMAEKILLDDSGITLNLGLKNVFDISTGKAGGWGISMDEIALNVTQNSFKKAWFKGKMETPLEGTIGYKCEMIAQGKAEGRAEGEEGFAYIFSTQQIDGLKFDFWLAEMSFDKDQTYFLLEAETYKNKEDEVRVELSIGGDLSITIGRDWLKKQGKVGAFLDAKIPGIHVNGMRIANCQRWKSKYFKNIYDISTLKDPKGATVLNKTLGFKEEYNCGSTEEKGNFYFSLGRWSLASLEKSIGKFKFGLKDYGFNLKGTKAELAFTGSIGICDVLTADCGIALTADVNISSFNFSFGGVEFKKASFNTDFGGVKIKGSLEASKGEDEGYKGELGITLPGDLFDLQANGGFYTYKPQGYSWGFFEASLKSAGGIPIPPIVINGVSGGFFFNCKPKSVNDMSNYVRQKGMVGFKLGMNITTTGGEKTLKAEMKLTCAFDTDNKKLSAFIMNGNLNALDGLVDAKAQLVYEDNNKSTYFNLNITASGGKALDEGIAAKFAAFNGKAMEAGAAIQQGLDKVTGNKSNANNDAGDSSKEFTAKCGYSVNLDFRIEKFKSGTYAGKTKWHIWLGDPSSYDTRCRVTLIDFQAGKKTDSFAFWAYLSANMYLCLGNELPCTSLPDIPQKAKDFLDGNDINGKKQSKSAQAKSDSNKQIKEFLSLINNSQNEGGIMLGACAEGDFGLNAGIVYAQAYFCLGFDVLVMKLKDGQKSTCGSDIGYKNWYGMGQAYAVMLGDIGLNINLWFIKKKISIIDVGLGALVQAGLPNPTWCYGTARAKLSLLDGVFSFDRSIEFKAGKVCKPDYGDPLDDIKIVADAQPGKTNSSEGYGEEVSVYSSPRFTTNFVIDKEVKIVDKNEQQKMLEKYKVDDQSAGIMAERTYRFVIDDVKVYNSNGTLFAECRYESDDKTNFEVICKKFEPNTKYYLQITSRAQEYRAKSGDWANPVIDGKRQEKKEVAKYYFKTGPLGDDITYDIAYSMPTIGTWDKVRKEDMKRPYICLNRFRDGVKNNNSNNAKVEYEYTWVLYKDGVRKASWSNEVVKDANSETWRPKGIFSFDNDYSKYRITLVRSIKGAGKNTKNKNKNVTKTKSTLQSKNGAVTNSSSCYNQQMQKFFANEEKEAAKYERQVTTTKTGAYTDKVALSNDEKEMFSITAKQIVSGSTFKTDKTIYPYETVYTAVSNIVSPKLNNNITLTTDNNVINKAQWKDNPYTQMLYYAHHAFLGGKKFREYAFSDRKINSISGLSITLITGGLREKSSVTAILTNATKNKDMYNNFDYWPFRCYNGGGWRQYTLANWGSNHSYEAYKFDVTNTDNAAFSSMHKAVVNALASDAYGVQIMCNKFKSDASLVCDEIKKMDKKYTLPYKFRNAVTDLNDKDYFTTVTANSGSSYTINSTSNSYPTLSYKTFSFSVPWQHYWLMANMQPYPHSRKQPRYENVENFNEVYESDFKFRYKDATTVWRNVRDCPFNAKSYLQSIERIDYEIWRVDRYNINQARNEVYDKNNSKNVSVKNPFKYYKF